VVPEKRAINGCVCVRLMSLISPAGWSVCLPLLSSLEPLKSRRRFLLAPATRVVPVKRAVNGCVCVCVCVPPILHILNFPRQPGGQPPVPLT